MASRSRHSTGEGVHVVPGCAGKWPATASSSDRTSGYTCGSVISRCRHSRTAAAVDAPPGPDQVLCLDLDGSHLTVLGILLDVLDQFLLLVLELGTLTIELSLRLFECALMLSKTLSRRHALAKGPFDDLEIAVLER